MTNAFSRMPPPSGSVLRSTVNVLEVPSFQKIWLWPPVILRGNGQQPLAMTSLVLKTVPDFSVGKCPLGDAQSDSRPSPDALTVLWFSAGVKLYSTEIRQIRSMDCTCLAAAEPGTSSPPTQQLAASRQAMRLPVTTAPSAQHG